MRLPRHSWVLTKLALTIGTATAAVFVLQPELNRAAAQALQVPLAELSTAGIGRLGVAVTLAPAGRCWYRWPPWRWRSSNPGDRPASGAADQPQRPVPGQAAPRCQTQPLVHDASPSASRHGGCFMTIRDHEVRLADGRILRTQDSGAADGQPVFLFHDGLGSRLVADPLAAVATHAGLRLLSHDRPGFGGSTAQPGRRVADAAADVTAIADQLGVDRFAVWGTSPQAAARSRWPAQPCCPTGWSPRRWSRRSPHLTRPDWTGRPAWPSRSPSCTGWPPPGQTGCNPP
jgi:hypothetical protein